MSKEQESNFTKEYAEIYFRENSDKPEVTLDYTYDGTELSVKLKKGFNKDGKKEYLFRVFEGKKQIFENEKKRSAEKSLYELFSFIYEHPIYKEWKSKNRKTAVTLTTEELLNDKTFDFEGYTDTFSTFVVQSTEDFEKMEDDLYRDKTKMTSEDLETNLRRYAETPEKRKKLEKLADEKKYLDSVEELISKTGKIPEKLLEFSSRNKGQVTDLEKLLINKAREIIVSSHIKEKVLDRDAIQEFNTRMFDWNLYGEKSPYPGPDGKPTIVPIKKNFYRMAVYYMKKEDGAGALRGHHGYFNISGEGSNRYVTYITTVKSTLEQNLNWDFEEILAYVVAKMQESVYFYQKNKDVSLETYLISSIQKSLNMLRNQSERTDADGGIHRWKDAYIKNTIKRAQLEMNRDAQKRNVRTYNSYEDKLSGNYLEKELEIEDLGDDAYNPNDIDNIMRYITVMNSTTADKGQHITKEEVEEFIHKLYVERHSFDESLEGDEGQESQNNSLLQDLWNSTGEDSVYDPQGQYYQKEKGEGISKVLSNLCETKEERIALELILGNITNGKPSLDKRAFTIDETEFNKMYVRKGMRKDTFKNVLESLKKKDFTEADMLEIHNDLIHSILTIREVLEDRRVQLKEEEEEINQNENGKKEKKKVTKKSSQVTFREIKKVCFNKYPRLKNLIKDDDALIDILSNIQELTDELPNICTDQEIDVLLLLISKFKKSVRSSFYVDIDEFNKLYRVNPLTPTQLTNVVNNLKVKISYSKDKFLSFMDDITTTPDENDYSNLESIII